MDATTAKPTWDECYAKYKNLIRDRAHRCARSRNVWRHREEIAQAAVAFSWKIHAPWDPSRSNFGTWFTVCFGGREVDDLVATLTRGESAGNDTAEWSAGRPDTERLPCDDDGRAYEMPPLPPMPGHYAAAVRLAARGHDVGRSAEMLGAAPIQVHHWLRSGVHRIRNSL